MWYDTHNQRYRWLHLVRSQYYTTIATVQLQNIPSSQKKAPGPVGSHSASLPSPVPGVISLLSVSGMPLLNILYKQNYITWLFLSIFFTQHNVFKIYSCCSMYQNFVTFSDCIIHHCMNIPLFKIHSSADGHLGCFCLLADVSMVL